MDEVIFKWQFTKRIIFTPGAADDDMDFTALRAGVQDTTEGIDLGIDSHRFHDEVDKLASTYDGIPWPKYECVMSCFHDMRDSLTNNQDQCKQNISDDQMRILKEMMSFLLVECNLREGEFCQLYDVSCIILMIRLLHVLLLSEKREQCKVWVKEHVDGLQSLRTHQTANYFMHFAMDGFGEDKLPSEPLVRLLVEECKVDVNIENDAGQTPLHWLSHIFCNQQESIMRIAELLINNGAHMDVVDHEGKEASGYLSARHPQWAFNFSLKCLAARAVLRHGVRYDEYEGRNMPSEMKKFITAHKAHKNGSKEEEKKNCHRTNYMWNEANTNDN